MDWDILHMWQDKGTQLELEMETNLEPPIHVLKSLWFLEMKI
jgi:hypothetical protein